MNWSLPCVGVLGRRCTVAGKSEQPMRPWNEEQLDFPFFTGTGSSPETVAESPHVASLHVARSTGRARGLASAIAQTRSALLGAPIEEVSAQLLPLLEFCEAALTRALDTVPLRGGGGGCFRPRSIAACAGSARRNGYWPSGTVPMKVRRWRKNLGRRKRRGRSRGTLVIGIGEYPISLSS